MVDVVEALKSRFSATSEDINALLELRVDLALGLEKPLNSEIGLAGASEKFNRIKARFANEFAKDADKLGMNAAFQNQIDYAGNAIKSLGDANKDVLNQILDENDVSLNAPATFADKVKSALARFADNDGHIKPEHDKTMKDFMVQSVLAVEEAKYGAADRAVQKNSLHASVDGMTGLTVDKILHFIGEDGEKHPQQIQTLLGSFNDRENLRHVTNAAGEAWKSGSEQLRRYAIEAGAVAEHAINHVGVAGGSVTAEVREYLEGAVFYDKAKKLISTFADVNGAIQPRNLEMVKELMVESVLVSHGAKPDHDAYEIKKEFIRSDVDGINLTADSAARFIGENAAPGKRAAVENMLSSAEAAYTVKEVISQGVTKVNEAIRQTMDTVKHAVPLHENASRALEMMYADLPAGNASSLTSLVTKAGNFLLPDTGIQPVSADEPVAGVTDKKGNQYFKLNMTDSEAKNTTLYMEKVSDGYFQLVGAKNKDGNDVAVSSGVGVIVRTDNLALTAGVAATLAQEQVKANDVRVAMNKMEGALEAAQQLGQKGMEEAKALYKAAHNGLHNVLKKAEVETLVELENFKVGMAKPKTLADEMAKHKSEAISVDTDLDFRATTNYAGIIAEGKVTRLNNISNEKLGNGVVAHMNEDFKIKGDANTVVSVKLGDVARHVDDRYRLDYHGQKINIRQHLPGQVNDTGEVLKDAKLLVALDAEDMKNPTGNISAVKMENGLTTIKMNDGRELQSGNQVIFRVAKTDAKGENPQFFEMSAKDMQGFILEREAALARQQTAGKGVQQAVGVAPATQNVPLKQGAAQSSVGMP